MNRRSNILRWAAFGTLAYVALARAQTTRIRLPYWDLDPTIVNVPETGLLYSTGFIFDALVWFAAAMTIAGELLARRRIHWVSGLLVLVGTVSAALHGLVLPPPGATPGGVLRGDFIGLALGSVWAAAVVGGWSMLHLSRDPAIRRAAALVLLGLVTTLVARGAHHVYIEHAHTVRQYRADPAAFLAAQGTEPGSVMAREFERRLMQPEAIGWFGLANVYGTLMGAAFVFFLGLSVAAWRRVREQALTSGAAGLIGLVCLAAGFGVYLSGSKGAMGATFAGILVMGVFAWSGGRGVAQRLARWTPLALTFGAIGAVVLRGMIGERIGELSLLFRWHYLVGATRIFGAEPLLGVGPNGFKNAYGLHKVPLNPEWVESPHSIFFDWLSTLGLFGAAWCAVLIWLIWRIGKAATAPASEATGTPPGGRRGRVFVLAAVPIVLATLTSWYHDWVTITPDEWPLRLIALAVWGAVLVIGGRVIDLSPRALVVSLAGAAVVVAVHSQIELTPTQPGSCMWVMLVIGAAGAHFGQTVPTKPRSLWWLMMAQGPLVIGLLILSALLPNAQQRELFLGQSAARARLVMRIEQLLLLENDPQGGASAGAELGRHLSTMDRALRSPFEGNTVWTDAGLARTELVWALAAQMRASVSSWPALPQVADLAIRYSLLSEEYTPFRPSFRIDGTSDELEMHLGRSPGVLVFIAAQREALTRHMAAAPQLAEQNLIFYRRALVLDPYALTPALRAYHLARQIGDDESAREMATLALRNNAYLRLDPLKQLSAGEVAELEAFLARPIPGADPSEIQTDAQ